jgi:hypothetical protein
VVGCNGDYEGEPSEPDDAGLGHCRADHPERLDRDRTIGMEIITSCRNRRGSISLRGANFSKSITFELSTSSAFSSSAVKVRNWPRLYSYPLTTSRFSISSPVPGYGAGG